MRRTRSAAPNGGDQLEATIPSPGGVATAELIDGDIAGYPPNLGPWPKTGWRRDRFCAGSAREWTYVVSGAPYPRPEAAHQWDRILPRPGPDRALHGVELNLLGIPGVGGHPVPAFRFNG